MADNRNHRRFMFKCIKASITPVSCKLKNLLKSRKSYAIIHKAEKQLLYERIRNINQKLNMLETNRRDYYSHHKNMINQHDHEKEQDISKCIQFIHKIKEHWHSKIKEKHINKLDHLYFKRFGYQRNFTRNTQNFDNIDPNNALSAQSNVSSNVSITSPNASGTSTVPATPMVSTPSSSIHPAPSAPTMAPGHQPSSSSHTCKTANHTKKWVINLSKTPLTTEQLSLLQKGPNFGITTKYPPTEAYITVVEEAASILPSMEADELRSNIRASLDTTTTNTTTTAT